MDDKEHYSRLLVNRLIEKGFPFNSVIFSDEVDSGEYKVPKEFDKKLFDIAVVLNNKVSELYVINPKEDNLTKIKYFSTIEENKEILIFKVISKNRIIDAIKLVSENSIKNLSDYVEQLDFCPNKTIYRRFYRGHSDSSWNLSPSIYRKSKRYSKKSGKKRTYVEYEDKMYSEALTYCSVDFPDENTIFENLVKLQHYEFPTRLLDLTMNSLVALYFAVKEKEDADGEVLLFEINKKDICSFDSKEVRKLSSIVKKNKSDAIEKKYNDVVCVIPKQNVDRLINQNGAFFLYGANENKINLAEQKFAFRRFIILKEDKEKIKQQLNNCGINDLELFPDLLSRLKYIKNHTIEFA